MRVLGLDLGARRIGLALSDSAGSIAFPHGAIERRTTKDDLAALLELIRDHDVKRAVVGWPIHMNGRVGPEAKAAEAFAAKLASTAGIPVEILDERWTTQEAERALAASKPGKGRSRNRERTRRERVDALAATLILRTYLERSQLASDSPS